MMMMTAPNSLTRQKDRRSGFQRKGGQTGTTTPGANVPTLYERSMLGMLDARNRGKMNGGMGFHSTGRAEGTRD